MSDTSQAAAAVEQQSAPPQSDVAAAIQQQSNPNPQGDTVPRDWFEKEKQNNIRLRNLYKRGDDLLRELDEPSQEAIVAIAEMARNRDVDGIIDWALGTVENLSGGDVAAAIARRQGGQVPQPFQQQPQRPGFNQAPDVAPLDRDEVARMVQEQARQIVRQEQLRTHVESQMRAAGYAPEHPAGQAILRYASVNNAPLEDAIQWFENDLATRMAARQQALTGAAGQVPPPSPTGAPAAGEGVNMTPRERAIRRLTGGGNPG